MKKITHYALRITNCISGSSEKQCVIRNAQCAMKKITHCFSERGGTGRIAGEAIYIAARDININGLIQSGYNGFKANNRLYVEDINATGGKVYLSGRILSTGNGKIVVTDGGGNIDITNSSKVDMSVGKVTSSPGGGFIQIIDTEQDKLTEYSTGQTRTINNYSEWLTDNTKGNVTTGNGLRVGQFIQYNPKAGLTYNWAEGQKQSTTYHYYKEEKRGWWGASSDSSYTGRYEDMSTVSTQVGQPEKTNDPLGKGTFIATSAQADNLKMSAQNSTSTNKEVK